MRTAQQMFRDAFVMESQQARDRKSELVQWRAQNEAAPSSHWEMPIW